MEDAAAIGQPEGGQVRRCFRMTDHGKTAAVNGNVTLSVSVSVIEENLSGSSLD